MLSSLSVLNYLINYTKLQRGNLIIFNPYFNHPIHTGYYEVAAIVRTGEINQKECWVVSLYMSIITSKKWANWWHVGEEVTFYWGKQATT